ncbi:CvpA family protein [bacterium]|nr:CvpA family protein [bacterium]
MTYIDYIVLLILAGFLVKGVFQGLIKQVMTIIGLIAGLALAWKFYPLLSPYAVKIGIPHAIAIVIAFVTIYVVVMVTIRIIANLIHKTVKFLFLGWINRVLGGLFGFLEGCLLIMILLTLLSFTPLQKIVSGQLQYSPTLKIFTQLVQPFAGRAEEFRRQTEDKITI